MTPITPATKSPTQDPLQLALTTYCQLLGKSTRVDTITEGLPLKNGRLTIDLITRALGNQGINAVIVEKTLHQLENYHLPVLLLTQYNTGLVLVSKDDEHCTVVVPETSGQKTYTYSELEALISLQVVLADIVYKADNRAKDFAQPYKKHWLKEQLMKCWPTYIDVGIASLFILTTGVVIAIIFDFILRVLRAYLLDVTGKKLDLELSSRLFSQILFMRLKAKPESTGAFSSQLKEFDSVREFFTSSTAASISDFPFIFLFLLLIWYLGGPVVLVPIIAILFMLLPSLLMQGKLAQLSREGMREGSVKQGLIIEVIEKASI